MQTQLGFIGIVTRDMGESLRFYRALGLNIPEGLEDQPHVDIELNAGVRLAWDTVQTIQTFDPHYEFPSGKHRVALAFNLGTADAVNDKFAALEALGYPGHTAPWDAFWGQRYATIFDPDGNSIDLYADL
ncbi:VOC family protein [Lysinibacter sp. HNR]|uniref:VOC family protein n=1 Tax=Lysinibacter sp. HNR TaxID=3031408 RepID=UPI0024360B2A|nr:VOC family protein [Lysinibacter sp. HNR]WGD36457.1 VOC family protein [Lysinibacter sp. HNR]